MYPNDASVQQNRYHQPHRGPTRFHPLIPAVAKKSPGFDVWKESGEERGDVLAGCNGGVHDVQRPQLLVRARERDAGFVGDHDSRGIDDKLELPEMRAVLREGEEAVEGAGRSVGRVQSGGV